MTHRSLIAAACVAGVLAVPGVETQDAAIPSFADLIAHPVTLKPELEAVIPTFASLRQAPVPLKRGYGEAHPRLFFDRRGLDSLRRKATAFPAEWQSFLRQSLALKSDPPAPPAQESGLQYRVGLALPEAAFAYAVDRDPRHLARARAGIDAVERYQPWGYTYNKPDQDIPAAFLLYGLAFAYDVLAPDLADRERARIESTITKQARLLYDAYRPSPKKRYSFSQNHTFINAAAVGFAGLVLHREG